METEIKQAIKLRSENKLNQSNQLLLDLVKKFPDDSYLNYQVAWSFDSLGEESSAVPYYEKAILGNLEDNDLQNAYLGLGSTLRTLGRYNDSSSVLKKGIALFPNNNALKTFYAMTLYNLNKHHEAMTVLLTTLANTTQDKEIEDYKRAILFYSDKLDETWL